MDEYYNAIQRLPEFIRQPLNAVPSVFAPLVQEIHLRSGRPVVLTMQSGQKELASLLAKPGSIQLAHEELRECFFALCQNSLHSYEEQLAQGFFTLPGGHRVGVAGLLRRENGTLKGFQSITSLNLRVARSVVQLLPEPLLSHLNSPGFRGLILIGPPGSGKTTLLRAVSSELSRQQKKVSVVDERVEIWPCGPFGFAGPVPSNCDVLSGFGKEEGIQQALRGLGPDVILCDELGRQQEIELIQKGAGAGVRFVCTMHGSTLDAPLFRFGIDKSTLSRDFSCLALLKKTPSPGSIGEVLLL